MRILFFLFLVLLPLGAPAQENAAISAEATAQDDAAIAVRLRDIMSALGAYDDVTVMVDDGVVTLRGTVTNSDDAAVVGALANRVEGVVAVRNDVVETSDIVRRLDPAIARFKARIQQFIAFLPIAMIGLAVFAGIVAGGFAIARMHQPWERLAPNAFIAEIYRQVLRIVAMVAGLVIALDIMNATALLSTILGAAGIIGLALSFAVKDTVENFIASIMLSIRQPFHPNDAVEINGDKGVVIRLTSRATILLSFDGNHIRIPNATVFNSRIVNFSRHENRRFRFSLLVDRHCDLQHTRELIEDTIRALPFVLTDPQPSTWIEEVQLAGISMTITGWINQHETSTVLAKGEAIRQVKRALAEADITLPDATQNVVFARKSETPMIEEETETVAIVTPAQDDALMRIAKAERDDEASEDLLSDTALKE